MKRAGLYSSSRRPHPAARGRDATPAAAPAASAAPKKKFQWKSLRTPAFVVLLLALAASAWIRPQGLLQQDVEAAIGKALEGQPRPFNAAEAYEKIAPSIVLVKGIADETEDTDGRPPPTSTGTGVVIVDTGIILTNLHVVHGSRKIRVTFADGLEAEATVIGAQPEQDLAVLKPSKVPDDLFPATMRSTADLAPGDPVVAVGFPFGIGPSASAGVISGLKREYRSMSGERVLSNLIQFDAAVNPGNSGGPLVTAEGEVVGIVTGLLNPTEQRVFVGIGFAVPIESAAGAAGLSPF
jgi:S1-C subfamily serine protease